MKSTKEQRAWYWYDWANSAYITTTATVIIGPYLTSLANNAACPDLADGATCLTPVMLLRRKGNRRHRQLGYAWVAAMLLTALTSLFFNTRSPSGLGVFSGDFSPIHILSGIVIVMVPRLVMHARAQNHRAHQRTVHGLVIGALLIAGFFTFRFDRMLGRWLFG